MSLFDDDFYSTRVSRRARALNLAEKKVSFGRKSGGGWSPTRIAVTSSVASAVAAMLCSEYLLVFTRAVLKPCL